MKSEEILKKMEGMIDDEMIKVISKKIIFDLDNVGYFRVKGYLKTEVICGGIIYIAYIKAGTPKPIDAMSNLIPFSFERKEINREIKHIKRALGMKYCKTQTMMGTACIVLSTPEDYFMDLCKKENSPQKVIDTGIKIAKRVMNSSLQSCGSPSNIGGTIFYIACILEGIPITQRSIAEKINSCEVTIRSIYHKILEMDKRLEKGFMEKHSQLNPKSRIIL
jgi:transcription initiation factor TFIIIB Brf1 subunit/transcription initiation factor TFIIB